MIVHICFGLQSDLAKIPETSYIQVSWEPLISGQGSGDANFDFRAQDN